MVTHPRAKGSASHLQPLNSPTQTEVKVDTQGQPLAIYLSGRYREVVESIESWRIDDEWWRDRQISRLYFRVLLEGGWAVDVFKDLLSGRWAKQMY